MANEARGARGRRFAESLDPDAAELNASVGFDWRLLPHDVAGSIAHAQMLGRRGILPAADVERIVTGLREIGAELAADLADLKDRESPLDSALEDIHMNVEARLSARIGAAGGRLHTARSRNDQVATDLRLYALASAKKLMLELDNLRRALLAQARAHVDTLVPGYTHLQRAQPIRLAHHLLAYVAMFGRDRARMEDAAKRADECPLGSGALAATTFPIDRNQVASDLGFRGVTRNSLDAAGDRDFAVELVMACALAQAHLSRLGEELVLWSSQEFQFAKLPEAYCSGSSIMPQKVNPDIPELVRAKTGRVFGDLMALLTVIKGLPLAYNKDLQETQEPLYDAVETLDICLRVTARIVRGTVFDVDRMWKSVAEGHLVATELADYLASKGIPFRRAHDVAGSLVRKAQSRGVELVALSLEELRAEDPTFDPDVYEWLDPLRAVDRRDVVGGPARNQVLAEISRLEQELG
ncbi:MAG: argininosuccinate lyase [Deltaproteobacteria bacterium]|nr:argininosuccinate lyase [Deltaproteobacteria bacterium]